VAELVLKEVGWKVPVEALTWWIKGLAQPDDWETRALDENGRLKKLRQFGWDVDFASYGELHGYWLPTRLSARRGDYSVKIAVREWRLGEESATLE
jgi:outer membrane lipoprotein LolB